MIHSMDKGILAMALLANPFIISGYLNEPRRDVPYTKAPSKDRKKKTAQKKQAKRQRKANRKC